MMDQENMSFDFTQPEEPVQESQTPETPAVEVESVTNIPAEYTHAERPSEKKKSKAGKMILCIASLAALVIVSCCGTAFAVSTYWKNRSLDNNAQMQKEIDRMQSQVNALQGLSGSVVIPTEGLTPGQVYATNVQAVVAISNQGITTNIYGQVSKTASMGSGFIISTDGLVVTNYHVIEGANQVSIITADEEEHKATVVGYDKTNDVALLRQRALIIRQLSWATATSCEWATRSWPSVTPWAN
jgi:S1-C subfamily serine protease